jgi:hypothetical protein
MFHLILLKCKVLFLETKKGNFDTSFCLNKGIASILIYTVFFKLKWQNKLSAKYSVKSVPRSQNI